MSLHLSNDYKAKKQNKVDETQCQIKHEACHCGAKLQSVNRQLLYAFYAKHK